MIYCISHTIKCLWSELNANVLFSLLHQMNPAPSLSLCCCSYHFCPAEGTNIPINSHFLCSCAVASEHTASVYLNLLTFCSLPPSAAWTVQMSNSSHQLWSLFCCLPRMVFCLRLSNESCSASYPGADTYKESPLRHFSMQESSSFIRIRILWWFTAGAVKVNISITEVKSANSILIVQLEESRFFRESITPCRLTSYVPYAARR